MDSSEVTAFSESTEAPEKKTNYFSGSPIIQHSVLPEPPVISLDSSECRSPAILPDPPVLPEPSVVSLSSDIPPSSDIFTASAYPTASDQTPSDLRMSYDPHTYCKLEISHYKDLCTEQDNLIDSLRRDYKNIQGEMEDVKRQFWQLRLQYNSLLSKHRDEVVENLRLTEAMSKSETICRQLKRKYDDVSE